jgi:hypothetical protein
VTRQATSCCKRTLPTVDQTGCPAHGQSTGNHTLTIRNPHITTRNSRATRTQPHMATTNTTVDECRPQEFRQGAQERTQADIARLISALSPRSWFIRRPVGGWTASSILASQGEQNTNDRLSGRLSTRDRRRNRFAQHPATANGATTKHTVSGNRSNTPYKSRVHEYKLCDLLCGRLAVTV